jgi:hypothetical protein
VNLLKTDPQNPGHRGQRDVSHLASVCVFVSPVPGPHSEPWPLLPARRRRRTLSLCFATRSSCTLPLRPCVRFTGLQTIFRTLAAAARPCFPVCVDRTQNPGRRCQTSSLLSPGNCCQRNVLHLVSPSVRLLPRSPDPLRILANRLCHFLRLHLATSRVCRPLFTTPAMPVADRHETETAAQES